MTLSRIRQCASVLSNPVVVFARSPCGTRWVKPSTRALESENVNPWITSDSVWPTSSRGNDVPPGFQFPSLTAVQRHQTRHGGEGPNAGEHVELATHAPRSVCGPHRQWMTSRTITTQDCKIEPSGKRCLRTYALQPAVVL